MNYYFTGVLIIMMTLLALCGGPATWLTNTYTKFSVFLINILNGLTVYLHHVVSVRRRRKMPRPVRKWIVRLRMWYADIRGHHGKKWNYESSDHYMKGRKWKYQIKHQ